MELNIIAQKIVLKNPVYIIFIYDFKLGNLLIQKLKKLKK